MHCRGTLLMSVRHFRLFQTGLKTIIQDLQSLELLQYVIQYCMCDNLVM